MGSLDSKIEAGKREGKIVVQHNSKDITFVAPCFGPQGYHKVGEQIDGAGLLRPTFAETVSLVYSVIQNQNNQYTNQVLHILSRYWLWGFSNITYIPREGVFISDRNRENVHVPFGFKTGEQSIAQIAKNPLVLALAEGGEGVEKLVEIAKTFQHKPSIWGLKRVDDIEHRAAGLDAYNDSNFNGLNISGDILLSGKDGYAFGLLE
ncbi:MAG TPA: hypothetical protein VI544_00650 [Candidatus Nanoarchaeia archaeon]|nr:hypothetical protein [Candidatus Nanoarchaeia archaeon]